MLEFKDRAVSGDKSRFFDGGLITATDVESGYGNFVEPRMCFVGLVVVYFPSLSPPLFCRPVALLLKSI